MIKCGVMWLKTGSGDGFRKYVYNNEPMKIGQNVVNFFPSWAKFSLSIILVSLLDYDDSGMKI
jgi:hypothetical protein